MKQIIISGKTFEKARKEINENKSKEIIFTNDDDDLNRKIIEKLPINILLLNQKDRKDFQKQRNSGLNQVLARIAKKNKISIGINLDEIIESSPKQKAEILARVKQNSENKRNPHDLKSLGLILGMPTWMTKGLN